MDTRHSRSEDIEQKQRLAGAAQSETADASNAAASRGLDLRRVLSLSWPERWLLLLGTLGLVVSSSSNLVIIGVAGRMVDVLVRKPEDAEKLLWSDLLFLCITFTISSFMTFVRAYYFTLAGERVVARLRAKLFSQILEQEIGFFDENRTGDVLSRLSDDCSVLQSTVTTNISMLLRNTVTALGTLVIIFVISWRLTLVMIAVVPLLAVSAVRYGKFVKGVSKQVQDALASASATAEETISNVRTVRSFASERWSTYKYYGKLDEAFKLAKKRSFAYGTFSGGMFLLANCALIGVLFYGGRLVLDDLLSVGNLLSFIMYTVSLAASLGMITSLFNDFMKAVGASKRVFDLIDRHPCIPIAGGDVMLEDVQGAIEFVDVDFTYPSRPDQQVLQGFSLSIKSGQTVALVGPSGGGKSTVVSLLKRFYDPCAGTVRIDGVDLRSLDRRCYMRYVASVMQEPVLFATSIKDNILYGMLHPPVGYEAGCTFNLEGLGEAVFSENSALKASAEDAGGGGCGMGGGGDVEMGMGGVAVQGQDSKDLAKMIESAARSANAWEFINSFSDGINTLVGERGVRLSGGQKQRIAIARALIKQPRILLLDEATSALDTESERLVQESIDKLLQEGGRTTIVVAHRLSTIRGADAIAVITSGKMVQMGCHDTLIQVRSKVV